MNPVQPLVSVIVPAYNQERTIGRALESILRQRVDFPYEVIVGDDASTDRTLEICRQYERAYPNVKVVANHVNLGLPRNYYNLTHLALGKYIADLAGDDQWCHPDKLQMQARAMEDNPRVTLCHTDWVKACADSGMETPSDPHGALSEYRQTLLPGEQLLAPLISHHAGPIVHSCTMMYRRDALLRAMQLWPELFTAPDLVCEDLQLIVSLAALGDVAYLPQVTLRYTVSGQSITGTPDRAKLCRFYAGSLRLTRALAQIHCIPDADMHPCYARMVPYIIDLAYRSRSRQLMRVVLAAASGLPLPLPSRIKSLLTLHK